MNLVLADTEEFRRSKRKGVKAAPGSSNADVEQEEKRTLGLIILRGTNIINLSVEGPPPADPSARLGTNTTAGPVLGAGLPAGPGVSRPAAGRGAPIGLQGPTMGVGGPAPFPPVGFPPGFGRGGPGGPPFPPTGFPGGGPPNFGPPGGFPPGPGRGFQPPPGFGGR